MSEDILERAKKALIDDDMTYEDYDECISLLIAEVERLRSLENCVSLVIDRQGKTNAALLGQLDVISAYLDAELVEWKNGDQIAEIAIKFMDLQKQKLNDANSQIAAKDARIKELEAENQQLIAFCKDYLSANERRLKDLIIRDGQIERLEAAFLEARHDWACSKFDDIRTRDECDQHAREALERIKEGQKG